MAVVIDSRSATWIALTSHVKDRREMLRTKLEGNLNADDTLVVRTQIRELNLILTLASPAEAPLIEEEFIDLQ
jgi:hypothetical protein